jgi:hypothetical protein
MKDRDLNDILQRAANAPHDVDPAVLDRISGAIAPSLRPVRPLPPARVLASGLVLIGAVVAMAGAASFGLHGIPTWSVAQAVLIFPVLAAFAWITAISSVAELTPGSARRLPAAWLPALGVLVMAAVFAVSFHDYRVDRFVPQGLVCLTTGLLHALLAGAGAWLLLRRGFAVDPIAAGLVTGTFASVAGVTMLELHCPNLEAPHILLWHTAVVPLSALAGALLGWVLSRRQPRQA